MSLRAPFRAPLGVPQKDFKGSIRAEALGFRDLGGFRDGGFRGIGV